MLVLGVDPGSRITGYGLVEKKNDKMACIHSGFISASDKIPFYARVHRIYQAMVETMNHFRPQEMAVEDVFYAKNIQSSLKLGHARGAVLIAAVECNVRIFEYTPLEIKKSVAGYGRATKDQVRSMVKLMLDLKNNPGYDTSDALATAICHLNWSDFDSMAGSEIASK
jgi:crossover junction endodeoxyribonuclease RuvC